MTNYIKYRNELINIGINALIVRDILIFDDYFKERIFRNKINFVQGSSKKVKFNGKYYKFNKTILDDGEILYVLKSQNNDIIDCIIISIVNKMAYICDIGNNKGCIKKDKIVDKGGTTLMNITLKLLKKIKNDHALTYIYLSDTATKTLFDNVNKNYKVNLSYLLFFTKGYTYYEKFGFAPIIQISNKIKISNILKHDYLLEKKRVAKLKMKNINFILLKKNINKKHLYLLKTLLSDKTKEMYIVTIIKYIANKKKYYPILNDVLNFIVKKLNINIPKLWGLSLKS